MALNPFQVILTVSLTCGCQRLRRSIPAPTRYWIGTPVLGHARYVISLVLFRANDDLIDLLGVFCEDYVFRLIGAPEDGGVDMHAVEAVVGRHAYHYMLGHYFTRGSMHVVAASYSQHRNNRLAFVAALMHRGLAPKIIGYLWHLVSYAGEQPDSEGIQINSNGSADARLAVEDDAVDSTNADE